ncbi:alpha/beta hydrolase [Streptomyces sp. GbtcB6]|uniref:alpha/beta hydrolase n=1 Tax=Streptomyces sp. GbtcB6 TaxID=2824751 RepID=UPI001C3026B0|nr:alpha/beta hydrolase [Streptomyces sp. GbtcB6]
MLSPADVPAAREATGPASGDGKPDSEVTVEDRVIPANGHSLGLRLYTPAAKGAGALPVAVWMHGGGFVLGGPNAEDATCRRLSARLGIAVVAPDYRLAPENPYPAAFDDCYAAVAWVVEEAEALGVDASRLALGGHSAGAALAAAVALAARDRQGPRIRYVYLGYPVLDDRLESVSAHAVTDPRLFNLHGAKAGWEMYLQGSDPRSDHAVPARAEDLRDLPPMYIMVAAVDPVRDETLEFAARLSEAGNAVEVHLVPGVPHMFDVLAPAISASRRAVDAWTAALADGIGVSGEHEGR